MARVTKTTISSAVVATGWLAAGADAFGALGNPLPMSQFVIALSALIVATLLVGIIWILRGPGYYKAMRLGEAIAEEKARRRDNLCNKAAAGSRVEVVT